MNNFTDNATSSIQIQIQSVDTASLSDKIALYRTSIGTGFGAIVVNLLIFAILFSNRKLLAHSALLAGVTLSHLAYGINLICAGGYRLANLYRITTAIHPFQCVILVYPLLYGFAFQSLAVLLCCIGLERLLAISAPAWFYNHWTTKVTWTLALAVVIATIFSLGVGSYYSWGASENSTTMECGQPNLFGKSWYVGYYTTLTIFGGTIGSCVTMIAYYIGRRRIAKSTGSASLRRQIQLTKAMLTVTCLDLCLVVAPTMPLFLANATTVTLPPLATYYATIAYGLNAMITIFAHLSFNGDFRSAALNLLRLKKVSNSITPIGNYG